MSKKFDAEAYEEKLRTLGLTPIPDEPEEAAPAKPATSRSGGRRKASRGAAVAPGGVTAGFVNIPVVPADKVVVDFAYHVYRLGGGAARSKGAFLRELCTGYLESADPEAVKVLNRFTGR